MFTNEESIVNIRTDDQTSELNKYLNNYRLVTVSIQVIFISIIGNCPGRTIRFVYGAVLLCPRLRENTVRLRRRIKQIYGENTDSQID
jgi:hypothetical protein